MNSFAAELRMRDGSPDGASVGPSRATLAESREGVFQRPCAAPDFPSAPACFDAHAIFGGASAIGKKAFGPGILAELHKILADFRSHGGPSAFPRAKTSAAARVDRLARKRHKKGRPMAALIVEFQNP